jgi:hypothetical protein
VTLADTSTQCEVISNLKAYFPAVRTGQLTVVGEDQLLIVLGLLVVGRV